MNVEAIGAMGAHDEVPGLPAVPRAPVSSDVPFSQLVAGGLRAVNEQLLAGQSDLQKLALGDVQNLHEVMVKLEESRISFQLLMQVRNRALEAYQDVMRMQI